MHAWEAIQKTLNHIKEHLGEKYIIPNKLLFICINKVKC